MTGRKLVFSVGAADMEWEFFRAGGPGGQNQNKRSTGVRCRHLPSGAVGESRSARTQLANRRIAFRKCAESAAFKRWTVREVARRTKDAADIDLIVEAAMNLDNLKIETRKNGVWVPFSDSLELADAIE